MKKASWSFQGRHENSGDNGNDFERFVLECFRVAREESAFVRSLRLGRDGAIDLIDRQTDPGSTTIAECKYIGAGDFTEAKARWKEVYRRLSKHLPRLSADSQRHPDSPYRAWLDADRPVRRYRFCITLSLTPNATIQLEKLIAEDFAQLAAQGVESVRHLAETQGAVRVLPWDWFVAELTACPSLAFRWFRGLPQGVNQFDPSGRIGQSFRDFLGGAQLPYFSRDRFAAERASPIARGEAELVADLRSGETHTLVLAGPGGIGKTRLAHELAIELTGEEPAFDGYTLERGVSASSIQELVARYPAKASLLLVIDYAEAAQRLGEIADKVLHLTEQAGHDIRIVATCRASATNRLRDDFEVLHPEFKILASPQGGESVYLDWVTESILGLEPFPEQAPLAKVCHGMPALAAFAVYLFRNDRSQFDAQFGALLASDDFRSWSNKRIAALLQDEQIDERGLAEIALALPIPPQDRQSYKRTHGNLLERLRTDRWIELVDEHLSAAHDILADALLARWLFEADNVVTERASDLLDNAASAKGLPHALTVLARLAAHPGFALLNGKRIVEKLLSNHPEQVALSLGILLESPLLQVASKLALVDDLPGSRLLIGQDNSLQVSLAKLAAEVDYLRRHQETIDVPAIFGDILEDICAQDQSSNFILRRAFAFDPSRFREQAHANIARFPIAESTHFLIVQMLRSGEPAEQMRDPMSAWLVVNSRARRGGYIYKAWLTAGGDPYAIRERLIEWVDLHGLTFEASHVYSAWLDAGGGPDAVGEQLIKWVELLGGTAAARFVYVAWLGAGGDLNAIREPLLEWVDLQGLTAEARFVYDSWLGAGGDRQAIRELLIDWVGLHGLSAHASHVYKAWLDAEGDLDAIREPVIAWVGQQGLTADAQFLYKSWLDAGGDRDAIREPMLAWMDLHGLSAGASHVYKAWLDADGNREAIGKALLAWIGIFGKELDAEFVYRAWLDAEGDFESIESHVFEWALCWSRREDFVFLSKKLSMQRNLPEPVALAIIDWSATFPEHEDSVTRTRRVLQSLPRNGISLPGLGRLLDSLSRLNENLGPRPDLDRIHMWSICNSLGDRRLFNQNPIGILRLFAKIVRSGTVFDRKLQAGFLPYLNDTHAIICQMAIMALRQELLDPVRDLAALTLFSDWLANSPPEGAEADRLVRNLKAALSAERARGRAHPNTCAGRH